MPLRPTSAEHPQNDLLHPPSTHALDFSNLFSPSGITTTLNRTIYFKISMIINPFRHGAPVSLRTGPLHTCAAPLARVARRETVPTSVTHESQYSTHVQRVAPSHRILARPAPAAPRMLSPVPVARIIPLIYAPDHDSLADPPIRTAAQAYIRRATILARHARRRRMPVDHSAGRRPIHLLSQPFFPLSQPSPIGRCYCSFVYLAPS